MSKGNLLFGQARGKVGDLVLTRLAGEQVARARNRAPKNPRTIKQMVQRAMMATLVEFFTRGQRNLFKFAFESKKPGESDYNAFVRANMGKVPVQSKKTIKENGFVGGDFIMSQGSLPAPRFFLNEQADCYELETGVVGVAGSALTIGKLSQLIIDHNALLNGDIITIAVVSDNTAIAKSAVDEAMEAGELVIDSKSTKWIIRQFTLDVNSTELVSTLGIFNLTEVTAQSTSIPLDETLAQSASLIAEEPVMATIIASRVQGSAVKVSTSQMLCSLGLAESNEVGKSDEWKAWVAKHYMEAISFDAKPEDILKGSISKN